MVLTNIFPMRSLRLLLPLLLVIGIQSCGFQLRGALEISQDVSPLYLQQNSAFSLGREVKQLLISNKIDITSDADKANSYLALINERKDKRVLSVDTDGRVREYLLTYTVDFSIQFKNRSRGESDASSGIGSSRSVSTSSAQFSDQPGVQYGRPQTAGTEQSKEKQSTTQSTIINESISVRRTLLFNQDAVLAVTNESEILYKDMRRDVARLILLKVQARAKEAEAVVAE